MTKIVCLLEDHQATRRYLSDTLAGEGIVVLDHAPSDGAPLPPGASEAGLILTDVVMDGCDGFEVLRHLRATGDRRPVIVYSNKSDIYLQLAEKLGATRGLVLHRWQDLRHVVEAVRTEMSRRHG